MNVVLTYSTSVPCPVPPGTCPQFCPVPPLLPLICPGIQPCTSLIPRSDRSHLNWAFLPRPGPLDLLTPGLPPLSHPKIPTLFLPHLRLLRLFLSTNVIICSLLLVLVRVSVSLVPKPFLAQSCFSSLLSGS